MSGLFQSDHSCFFSTMHTQSLSVGTPQCVISCNQPTSLLLLPERNGEKVSWAEIRSCCRTFQPAEYDDNRLNFANKQISIYWKVTREIVTKNGKVLRQTKATPGYHALGSQIGDSSLSLFPPPSPISIRSHLNCNTALLHFQVKSKVKQQTPLNLGTRRKI